MGMEEVIVGQQGNCSTVPRHLQYIIFKRRRRDARERQPCCLNASVHGFFCVQKGRENELLDYFQRLCLHDTLGCAPVLASCLGHQRPSVASLSGHHELHNLTSSNLSSGL